MWIEIDYSFDSQPRYGYGKPPHPELHSILNTGRERYAGWLKELVECIPDVADVPVQIPPDGSPDPYWSNPFLPPLDAIALHGILASVRPVTYLEIGSGNSTKFAHRAIRKRQLKTRIVSIDPYPRAEIDTLCNELIRSGLETCDLGIFERLEADSIVFFDGSHRCLMGSDVTVFFFEVLPRLKPGTLVHVHDIFLPYDYFPQWRERYYSEQYILAALLMGGGKNLQIELPVAFVSHDPELAAIMTPFWGQLPSDFDRGGGSFWMRRV